MARRGMSVFAGVVFGCGLTTTALYIGGHAGRVSAWSVDVEPIVETTRRVLAPVMEPDAPEPVTVVLSRDGDRVYAGPDLAAHRISWVLAKSGKVSVDLPAFRGSDQRWRRLGACVREQFRGFRVRVLDQAPPSGDYMVVHVGGTPAMLGAKPSVRGLAPHTSRVIGNATVFVFDVPESTVNDLCEVAAHEIGHAIGLDHSVLCSDIMSYGGCGPKSFQDQSARCGETTARDCDGGAAIQNSVERLEALVGRWYPNVS